MVKKQDELDKLLKEYLGLVKKAFYVKKAFLYGSYANGKAKDQSDIDIALVSPDFEDMPIHSALKILFKMARHIDDKIEPVALTEEELQSPPLGSIAYDIVKTGKEL